MKRRFAIMDSVSETILAWEDAEHKARETAQEYADELGNRTDVLKRSGSAYPEREPLPRHRLYGLTPGVDFPGSLGPERW